MDLIRRNMFFIICGLATAGGIALGVTGIQSMPKVRTEMENVGNVFRNLDALQSKPVNRNRIEAERERIQSVVDDRNAVIKRGFRLYGYDQLVPGVLPYGTPVKRIEFRKRYVQAMNDLFTSLTAGSPADSLLIKEMRDKIENENAERSAGRLDPGAAIRVPDISGPPRTPSGVLTTSGAALDGRSRAHLAAAQRVYCYGVDFDGANRAAQRFTSLQIDTFMVQDLGTVEPPLPEDVWRAQLSYWIQKDVVEAIVAINGETAAAAEKEKRDPWVGIMPVKDVISIRVPTDFVPLDADVVVYGAAPGGTTEAFPPGTSATVFTESGSGEAYEVVQFTVKLVMDQRDIPLLVARLSNNRFHTLLRASYQAVPVNRDMVGKIYGSDPAVNVVMDFETILLGEVFRRLMPQTIRDDYEVQCRKADECEEES